MTTNVSEHGCTIVTGERAETVGARIQLELVLPSAERVRFLATVAWSREPTRASSGGVILPGHSGLAFAIGEPAPPPFSEYLARLAELDCQLPDMPHHLESFLAEAILERRPAAPRSTPLPSPRPLTPTERIRRAVVTRAQQIRSERASQPPPRASQSPPRPSQPPPRASQPPPRASQPPPRPSQPPPRASQPPPRASQPPPSRPILPVQSSLGLLPPTPATGSPRALDQVTDEALDRVLCEFLVTRSDRIRSPSAHAAAAARAPHTQAELDALLRDFLREVDVPAKAVDGDVDRVVDAMLSESTWWVRGRGGDE